MGAHLRRIIQLLALAARSPKKPLLAVFLVTLIPAITAAAVPPGRLWVYQYVLATARTEQQLVTITDHITKDRELREPELLDFVAEVLLARVAEPAAYPRQYSTRLINALASAKNSRYNATLDRVIAISTSKELAKVARAAKATNQPGVRAYVPGSIDIRAIVADMDAAALAARPATALGYSLAQFPGGSIDELFEWAGRPQQIVIGQTRVTDGFVIDVKVQRLTFFYRGVGRVVYGYSNGLVMHDEKGWLFQAVVADPLAFEDEFSYRDRAQELGMPDSPTLEMIQLSSGYTASIKHAVEVNYRRESRPLEFMDTAAEILATQFKTADDPVKVDMFAWICRLLTERGGPRYAALLARVAAETPDDKLKRFATRPIESAPGVPSEPYVTGAISLAAQRAKYPSLYPESTFQSGRL